MRKCSVEGCNSCSTDVKRRTFPFPDAPGLRKKWLTAIGRPGWKPAKASRICLHHFTPEDLEKYHRLDGKVTNVPLALPKLSPAAVPSVFPGKPHPPDHPHEPILLKRPPNDKPNDEKLFDEIYLNFSDLEVKLETEENPIQIVVDSISSNAFLLCRVCESVEDLIDITSEGNVHFREKLHQISGLNDNQRDDLLKFICRQCGEKLVDLSTFKSQCEITYKKLLGEITRKEETSKDLSRKAASLKEETADDEDLIEFLDQEESESENHGNYWAGDHPVEPMQAEDTGNDQNPSSEDKQSDIPEGSSKKREYYKTNYYCRICKELQKNKYEMERHQMKHNGKSLKCNFCDVEYSCRANLRRHIKQVHEKRRDHICMICNKAFSQAINLKTHMSVHELERKYECDTCHKAFKHPKGLTLHKYTHIPPEERSESVKKALIRSQRGNQKRLYVCPICGKTSNYLTRHLEHIRSHTGEKPYKCNHCDKSFGNHNTLRSHVRIHTGEKPYKCETCGATFRQGSHLRGHMLLHTGEKPHKCLVCEKEFRNKSNFSEHMRMHTGEKPNHCRLCPEKFKNSRLLKKHCQAVHFGMADQRDAETAEEGSN
ncbi:zinc finger protein 79-like [Phlebotomus argentipes]|uniref:zinc finger protein 79-like n=1 Tax=Phlebotomus argentipes TaxID=94469 RepID=UPI002892D105|nr:zinc finger protein 79-like [Phlebotomus argentipes]